jgi:predicted dehydrogenase
MAGGMPNKLHYEIFGTKGSLIFTLERPSYLRVYLEDTMVKEIAGFTDVSVTDADLGHPYTDVFWPKGHNVGWEHGHIAAIAHFFDCVAKEKAVNPMGATFFDGYAAEKIIEMIKQSSLEGKRLDVVL